MIKTVLFYVYSIVVGVILTILVSSSVYYSEGLIDVVVSVTTISALLSVPYFILLDRRLSIMGNLIDYYAGNLKFNNIIGSTTMYYSLQAYLLIVIVMNTYSLFTGEYNVNLIYVMIGGFVVVQNILLYTYLVNYFFLNKYAASAISTIKTIVISLIISFIIEDFSKSTIYYDFIQNKDDYYYTAGPLLMYMAIYIIFNIILIILLYVDKADRSKEYRLKFLPNILFPLSYNIGFEYIEISEELSEQQNISDKLQEKIDMLVNNKETTEVEINSSEIYKAHNILSTNKQLNIFTNIFIYKYTLSSDPNTTKQQINDCLSFKKVGAKDRVTGEYPTTNYRKLSVAEKNEINFKIASELNFDQYVAFIGSDEYNDEILHTLNEVTNNKLKVIKINWD